MKKLFEDRITDRIKEVMEQYEPDYSPQAWEKFRKQMPVPGFWLRKLFLKYRYWFSGVTIVGVLVIVSRFANVIPADKNSAADPLFSESANYFVSEKPKEITYSEKKASSGNNISDIGISRGKNNLIPKVTPVRITYSLPATYKDDAQSGNAIADMPGRIEKPPFIPVLPEGTDFGNQYNNTRLIPIKSQPAEIPVLKSASFEKKGKSEFQWPEFNSLFTHEDGYDKFAGPNKLAIFYSPETLHSNSLNSLGISHGIGISLEGPIRSSASVSAGLSYQSINFRKTIFSVIVFLPGNNENLGHIDSIGIRSGSYEYLEVPVSLSFKFFESTRSQVWLGTGISSIVFLRQNYASETIVGGIITDQISSTAKGWENILLLASLNFSLLYRYQFSDRLFLHSAVQYKNHMVPLSYNSMKLNRLNFQAGLVYRFGRED